jgi:hypothetical protein
MAFDPITSALEIGGKLIDKLIPDPTAKAQAQLALLKMKQDGDLAQLTSDTELAKAQTQVNLAEASSSSLFVAGGRPFILWVCGVALANDFIVRPFAVFVASLNHVTGANWPSLDMASLMPLLLGMLGLGAMRTYEKVQANKS